MQELKPQERAHINAALCNIHGKGCDVEHVIRNAKAHHAKSSNDSFACEKGFRRMAKDHV